MSRAVRELIKHRDLLYMLTWRDIRIRYKQSVMGFLWAILMPALIVAAGVLVRYAFAITAGTHMQMADVLGVSVKSIPWAFIVGSIRFSTSSLIGNTSLVTKIYMPREIFPLAAVLSQLMDFAVALALLVVLLAVAGVTPSWELLWVPVLLALIIIFVTGWAILLSAASLFFRDVKYIVEVVLTFAIFFTPVFYDASAFPRYQRILFLNPVAPLLDGLSAVVVHHRAPNLPWLGYSAACSLGIVAFALLVFKKVEPYFAESI